ncbi:MAG: hypothetical protein K9M56_08170 [Victivallales bacterium]|nr:hypothetical protein [Victivallales bacterium]
MKLRKNHSYLNVVPDGSPKPRKGPKVFRFCYFTLLVLIFIYVFYYFINHAVLFVYGKGQVEFEKYFVQTKRSCEILKYMVNERDTVTKGTPLVKTAHIPDEKTLLNKIITEQRLKVLNSELEKKLTELKEAALFKSLRKDKGNDYTILSRERESYAEAKDELDNLRMKIRMLKADHPLIFQVSKTPDKEKPSRVIRSKFNGFVFRNTRKRHEFVKEGERLLILENPKKIIIYASFNSEYQKYLGEGDLAVIEFPNGEESKSRVHRFYTYSYFYGKKTMGDMQYLIAEIYPESNKNIKLWKKYKGTEVTVRLPRKSKIISTDFLNKIYNMLHSFYSKILTYF